MLRFSQRTGWNTESSALAAALAHRLALGLPVRDLTASNPTRCGFSQPESLLHALANPQALVYDPQPLGLLTARQAIANCYSTPAATCSPHSIVLTTSTSEAYSFLFKLLTDPGDEILVPQPSYPLFDYLADIEVVRVQPVHFLFDGDWQLDLNGIEAAITPRSRAIVLVHPNNPTGHYTSRAQAIALGEICARHSLALIVDEVFLDYALAPREEVFSFASLDLPTPTFVVSGISKLCGLPQMKAAWILVTGTQQAEALARLEVIADTLLSMNAPIQHALPQWLARRAEFQQPILDRVRANLASLDSLIEQQSLLPHHRALVTRMPVQGGWYAVLRIPALGPDEQTCLELLHQGTHLHPGHFFGFPPAGWLVASLLTAEEDFAAGIEDLIRFVQSRA